MQRYQQNATHVGVWNNGETYTETVENFALDYGQPAPALPAGILDRTYEPGVRHALCDAAGVNPHMDAECPRVWPIGDEILKAIYDLRVNQLQRETQAKIDALNAATAAAVAEIKSRQAAADAGTA